MRGGYCKSGTYCAAVMSGSGKWTTSSKEGKAIITIMSRTIGTMPA